MSEQNDTGPGRHVQNRNRLGRRFQAPLPGEPVDKSRKTQPSSPLAQRLRALGNYQAAVHDLREHAGNFDLFDREGLLAEWVANNAVRIVGLNETLVGLYGQIGLVVDQQPNIAAVGEVEHHERVVVSDAMSVLVADPSHQHPGPGVEVVGGVGDPVESFEQGVGDVVDVVSGVEFVPDAAVDENAGHDSSPSVGGCGDHSVGESGPAEDSAESSAGTPATSAEVRLDWPGSTAKAALVSDAEGNLYVAAKTPVGMVGDEAHEFANLIRHLSEVAQLACGLRVAPSTDDLCKARQPDMTWIRGDDHELGDEQAEDERVDRYAQLFLDGAAEWWREEQSDFAPAPMTPAVKSGIRAVLAEIDKERPIVPRQWYDLRDLPADVDRVTDRDDQVYTRDPETALGWRIDGCVMLFTRTLNEFGPYTEILGGAE